MPFLVWALETFVTNFRWVEWVAFFATLRGRPWNSIDATWLLLRLGCVPVKASSRVLSVLVMGGSVPPNLKADWIPYTGGGSDDVSKMGVPKGKKAVADGSLSVGEMSKLNWFQRMRQREDKSRGFGQKLAHPGPPVEALAS